MMYVIRCRLHDSTFLFGATRKWKHLAFRQFLWSFKANKNLFNKKNTQIHLMEQFANFGRCFGVRVRQFESISHDSAKCCKLCTRMIEKRTKTAYPICIYIDWSVRWNVPSICYCWCLFIWRLLIYRLFGESHTTLAQHSVYLSTKTSSNNLLTLNW